MWTRIVLDSWAFKKGSVCHSFIIFIVYSLRLSQCSCSFLIVFLFFLQYVFGESFSAKYTRDDLQNEWQILYQERNFFTSQSPAGDVSAERWKCANARKLQLQHPVALGSIMHWVLRSPGSIYLFQETLIFVNHFSVFLPAYMVFFLLCLAVQQNRLRRWSFRFLKFYFKFIYFIK